MSSIKICDKCKSVFPERQIGSSMITSGVVYREGFNTNLQGDFCRSCTDVITDRGTQIAINPPDREYNPPVDSRDITLDDFDDTSNYGQG